jgi:hypothetical protein
MSNTDVLMAVMPEAQKDIKGAQALASRDSFGDPEGETASGFPNQGYNASIYPVSGWCLDR